jgi:hypothetical protein
MKKINIKTVYCLILGAVFGVQSCTDFLNTSPYNQVASSNMWTNPALTNQGVAGVYEAMRNWGVYGAASYGLNVIPFECLGMTGQAYRSIPYLQGTAGSGDAFFSDMWRRLYEGVHRSNDAIAALSQPGGGGVDDETRLRLLAECKFLRAYYYTRLNELYGRYGLGVPLYTEPIARVEDVVKSQSPEAEVWAQIVQDLTDCINEPNFPNRWREKGRASKGAAYALRGRAYLMQGAVYNYNNTTGSVESISTNTDFLQKAVADFAAVKGCGFDLFQGGFKELFTEAHEGSIEMIFSLQNIARPGYGSRMQLMAGSRSAGDITGSTGFSQYGSQPAIVDLFEYKDGTPFNWDNHIPGYMALPAAARIVYWLRDREKDGEPIPFHQTILNAINSRLNLPTSASVREQYLPEGNEARLATAWENRDPRLQASVIVPYGDIFYGTDHIQFSAGNRTPVPYVFRWPVGVANQSVAQQTLWGISSPYDLRHDGAADVEFSYRPRKFVMEGYECEYITNNPIDEPILRYAYVLLMWAEALTHLGDLSGAVAKVNEVRARKTVEMPPYSFIDKVDAMSKIRNESRREFVNEGINFYEELRWGTLRQSKFGKYMGYDPAAHTVFGTQSNGNGGIAWSSVNDFSIFPVPASEIEKNSNLKKTPGWIY